MALAATAFAANPFNRVQITLTNTTSTQSDKVLLIESEDFTPNFENGYDEAKALIGGSIYVYAITNYGQQSKVYTNSWNNLPIGYQNVTNSAATFSFSFDNFKGDFTYYLFDKTLKTMTLIKEGATYEFTVAANEVNETRFEIVKPTFKVCTTFDQVEIYDNEGSDNIVITNAAGETVVDVVPVAPIQVIDLSGKPAGHYFLTVNGETYEFCNKPEAK